LVINSAYRLCKEVYASSIWSGVGARDYGGRWNSKGVAVVYTAQSKSLAALEQLVNQIKARILNGFVVARIQFDDSQLRRISPSDLPAGWASAIAPPALRQFGDEWVAAGKSAVLAVPSAVIPGEWNHLFNPAHIDFAEMAKSPPEPFAYDDRLG